MSKSIYTPSSYIINHPSELSGKFKHHIQSEVRKHGYIFDGRKFNVFISMIKDQYYRCYILPKSYSFNYMLNNFCHESYKHLTSPLCGLKDSYITYVDPYLPLELLKTENKQNKLLLLL